jgi:hypothetical protein
MHTDFLKEKHKDMSQKIAVDAGGDHINFLKECHTHLSHEGKSHVMSLENVLFVGEI